MLHSKYIYFVVIYFEVNKITVETTNINLILLIEPLPLSLEWELWYEYLRNCVLSFTYR